MVKRKAREAAVLEQDDDSGIPIAQTNGAEPSKSQLVALHRARFLKWAPTAAVACACTEDGALLAIARESGNIALWETENWVVSGVCLVFCY